MKCPCKDCDHRTITCHGVCRGYQGWKADHEELMRKKRAEKDKQTSMPREVAREYWERKKRGR